MKTDSTTELLNILSKTNVTQTHSYLSEISSNPSIQDYFSAYISNNDITASQIVKNCKGIISKTYIYDILNGKRTNPSRDYLICICLSAHMNYKQTRRTFELFGINPLYAKSPRDAIIIININNKVFNINQINEQLEQNGLDILQAINH